MDATRDLLIAAFQHPSLSSKDLPGLALALAVWLDISRPTITMTTGRFTILCGSPRAAALVSERWGGTARGRAVHGWFIDLTS